MWTTQTAAKKAMEYLEASMYKDRLAECRSLLRAVGRSRQGAEGAEHAEAGRLAAQARRHALDGATWSIWRPRLNWDDLNQTAALPLGSWLKTDPWDDKVHMLNAKRYAPMNARDKMPFEVTPVFYKLQRYDAANAAPAAAAAPAAQPASDQPAASAPDNAPPAPPAAQPANSAAAPSDQQPTAAQNPQP